MRLLEATASRDAKWNLGNYQSTGAFASLKAELEKGDDPTKVLQQLQAVVDAHVAAQDPEVKDRKAIEQPSLPPEVAKEIEQVGSVPHAGVTQPAPAPPPARTPAGMVESPPADVGPGPAPPPKEHRFVRPGSMPPPKGWRLVIAYNAKATREFMEREGWRYLQVGVYDKKVPAAEAEGTRAWARSRADKVEVKDTTPPEGSS